MQHRFIEVDLDIVGIIMLLQALKFIVMYGDTGDSLLYQT